MKVLFLGDVFGKPGRQAVQRCVPRLITLKNRDQIDLGGIRLEFVDR